MVSCSGLGPKNVVRDQFDYNVAISSSWKEQTLLNIVKLRYADMPLFVEVGQVVSGYSMESSMNLGGTTSLNGPLGDALSLGGAGKYTDRPTITYVPITGKKFHKNFMQPIPPSAILFLIQAGWSADQILNITLNSINGLRSSLSGGANMRTGDPEFYRTIELFSTIQQSGVVGMRIIKGEDLQASTVIFFHQKNITPENQLAIKELVSLLGLRKGVKEITVSYGSLPRDDREIAMHTRSMMQVMIELASQLEVPDVHVEENRAAKTLSENISTEGKTKRLISIKSGTEEPEDAFTAVKYRDWWFWIDDRDFASKRTFSFLMLLFSLMETDSRESMPLVTIPAG